MQARVPAQPQEVCAISPGVQTTDASVGAAEVAAGVPEEEQPQEGAFTERPELPPELRARASFVLQAAAAAAAATFLRRSSGQEPQTGRSSASTLIKLLPSFSQFRLSSPPHQVLGSGSKCGLFCDSAAELLWALSQEERELLETITEKGYSLRTAIRALQKTGYRSAEKVSSRWFQADGR